MGKANPNIPKKIRHYESLNRCNVLFQQACHLIENGADFRLIFHYMSTMSLVTRKAVLRLHPTLKRKVCTCCHCPLVPGLSATVRIRSKKSIIRCNSCATSRTFLATDKYPSL
ncbi:hypothetical protein P9112_002439 [Eukaryota sp. TZLM1-RC]